MFISFKTSQLRRKGQKSRLTFAFSLKRYYFMFRELLHAVCALQKLLSANINYNIGEAAGWQAFAEYWPAKGCSKEWRGKILPIHGIHGCFCEWKNRVLDTVVFLAKTLMRVKKWNIYSNLKTSHELRMLSRSLSDFKSLLLNVRIQVLEFGHLWSCPKNVDFASRKLVLVTVSHSQERLILVRQDFSRSQSCWRRPT